MLDALPKAAKTVKNALLAERISKARYSIQAGSDLTQSLMQLNEFNNSTLQTLPAMESEREGW